MEGVIDAPAVLPKKEPIFTKFTRMIGRKEALTTRSEEVVESEKLFKAGKDLLMCFGKSPLREKGIPFWEAGGKVGRSRQFIAISIPKESESRENDVRKASVIAIRFGKDGRAIANVKSDGTVIVIRGENGQEIKKNADSNEIRDVNANLALLKQAL